MNDKPAFPGPYLDKDGGLEILCKQQGMTLREYAAIKLKVPDSGTEWLDKMIEKSLINDFQLMGDVALKAAARQALECLRGVARGKYDGNAAGVCAALEAALAQQAQEPVALKWLPAPRKTEWGFGMVSADVEIDRDHTLTMYCEDDQTAKVDAMFRRVFCKEKA